VSQRPARPLPPGSGRAAGLRGDGRTPPPRRRRRGSRLGLIFAVVALVVVLLAGAGGVLVYARVQLEPVTSAQGPGVSVTVTRGESLQQLAADLESMGLINSSTWFAALARLQGIHLTAGTYILDSGMGATEMLHTLEAPPHCGSASVPIPEGLTAAQIAARLAATPGLHVTVQQYLDALQEGGYNAPFLAIRPAGDTSLEGFLFPDTYSVSDCATARDIVQQQLDEFGQYEAPTLSRVTSAEYGEKDGAYAALITASMLQAEVHPADFAGVASVIENRIQQGMPLQIDATVLYGAGQTGNGGQVDFSAAVKVDTAYNTYLNLGLPPTPIGNPGWTNVNGSRQLAALQAALAPPATDYLYYVTDSSGNAHFSATYAQQLRAECQYLNQCG
jgi:UPF0755 protein